MTTDKISERIHIPQVEQDILRVEEAADKRSERHVAHVLLPPPFVADFVAAYFFAQVGGLRTAIGAIASFRDPVFYILRTQSPLHETTGGDPIALKADTKVLRGAKKSV